MAAASNKRMTKEKIEVNDKNKKENLLKRIIKFLKKLFK